MLDWSAKEFDTHTYIHMLRSHQFSRWKVYNNSIYNVSTTLIAISCTVSLPLKEVSQWKCRGERHKESSKSRNLGIPRNSTISSTSLPNRFKKYFLCHLTFRQKYTRCPSSPHARGFTLQMRRISNEMNPSEFTMTPVVPWIVRVQGID